VSKETVVDAQFYSAKHFVPRMRGNGYGRSIAISLNSIGIAEQGRSAYRATKKRAIRFMRRLPVRRCGDKW
jgi:NAD(P)-dependent dehydrogenase (short-subunit alcohol dehydrogenase family)